jgi:hypothetical protein
VNETPELLPVIVIRLTEPAPEGDDLRELAKRAGYRGLAALLEDHREIEATRAIQNVDPKELLAIERRARDSDYPPLHSLTSFWRLDCSAIPDVVEELIGELSKLPEIGLAYRESDTTEPGTVTNPGQNPRYAANEQGYLANAPAGIGVTHAWGRVDGSGVRFADIEQGWLETHEDLVGLAPKLLSGNATLAAPKHHGAAVLGIVVGRDNMGVGIIGIAPGVTKPLLSTPFLGATTPNVAEAVLKTVLGPDALAPGDVLLIEVQLPPLPPAPGIRPAEAENLTFNAIRLASALGIVVVEAAGNGEMNLITLPAFKPLDPLFQGDSGAVIVASLQISTVLSTTSTTNYGSRIDCHAWGENVTTASGDGEEGATENTSYTRRFGGTSAAAAIVAGAAILVQDLYQQPTATRPAGERLSPRRMRQFLTVHSTPAPSSAKPPAGTNIRGMPNLAQLVTAVGDVPDLYIRDYPGDTGAVPSTGLLSVSPDVVVSKTSLSGAALTAAFAAGTSEVERGHDNFIYVRVSNRNDVQALNAKVKVYWSKVATLITPVDWKLVNPIVPPADAHATLNVPPNGLLVEAPEIPWSMANLPPASGHYCFVATVDHPLDPEPLTAVFEAAAVAGDLTPAWEAFFMYVRNNNNVTWRNFNAVDLPAPGGGAGGAAPAPFLVSGAPDAERYFDLEILQSCPDAVSVVWDLPRKLFRQLDADFAEVRKPKGCRFLALLWPRRYSRVSAVLQPRAELVLPRVSLEKSARHQCRFRFAATETLPEAACTVAIRQLYDGIEVGRVTWELRAGRE